MKTRSQWLVAALALSVLCTVVGQLRSADGEKPAGGDLKNDAKPIALRRVGEEDIRKELAAPADLKFDNVLLSEIIPSIADKHHIEIQVDEAALKDASIDPSDIRVSAEIRGVSLGAGLKAILSPLNLTYQTMNEILAVTTTDRANAHLAIRIYDLHNLIGRGGPIEGDYDSLINLMISTIAPPTWDCVGGQGTIQCGPSETLIVAQTDEILEQISNLVAALNTLAVPKGSRDLGLSVEIGESPADRAIEQTLSNKVDLNSKGALLSEVVPRLAADSHLNIQIDSAGVKQLADNPLTVPITQEAKGISLKSALRLILNPLKLSYVIENETVLITTAVRAERTLVTRLYPIGDFGDAEELASNIRSTIFAPFWDEVGGQGTMAMLGEKSTILSISQTQQVHEAIAEFLAGLRNTISKQPAREKIEELPILFVYDLKTGNSEAPVMTPQEVAEVVKGLVATKSWTQPDIYIRGVTGKLIVKQSITAQKEIMNLLRQLDVQPKKDGNETKTGKGGFGGGGF